ELARREVNGHCDSLAEALLQDAGLLAGLLQDPLAERQNEAALFGCGDELLRTEKAAVRVTPAEQRFNTDEFAGAAGDLRLVEERHLIVDERSPEVGLELEFVSARLSERSGKKLEAVAAAALGGIHGGIGVAEQRGGVGAPLRGEAEAEAGGDAQFLAGELERALELAREPAGGAHGVILAAAIGHDDDEGVAANPGDGVIGAGGVPKAVGENGQQFVAGGVAERIVHALEVVEPDGENCYRL